MSRESLLVRARAAAVRGMTDTCTITREADGAVDENTGRVAVTTQAIYTGVCRVQSQRAQSRAEDVGEDYKLLLPLEVQLPITVTGMLVGDIITITASVNDADLVGRKLRVRDPMHKTDASARRPRVEEVVS